MTKTKRELAAVDVLGPRTDRADLLEVALDCADPATLLSLFLLHQDDLGIVSSLAGNASARPGLRARAVERLVELCRPGTWGSA